MVAPPPAGPRIVTGDGDRRIDVARDAVLGRIRHALRGVPEDQRGGHDAAEREYRRGDRTPVAGRLDLLAERLEDYRATVQRCAPDDIAATAAEICVANAATSLVVPVDVPDQWRPSQVLVIDDNGQFAAELDQIDGVLTGCAVAIAETGTIVLDGGATQGRRALTLVPDLHICVVRADQIEMLVPDAVERLTGAVAAARPLTFISGPSATSDIELSRVEGVHGPRRLHVLLIG